MVLHSSVVRLALGKQDEREPHLEQNVEADALAPEEDRGGVDPFLGADHHKGRRLSCRGGGGNVGGSGPSLELGSRDDLECGQHVRTAAFSAFP